MPDEPLTEEQAKMRLFEEIWSQPQGRRAIQIETRRLRPNVPIPDLDAAIYSEQMAAELKAVREERASLAKDNNQRVLDAARAKAVKDYALVDADIPEVEKIMLEQSVGTHDAAAEILASRRMREVATPRSRQALLRLPGSDANEWFATSPDGISISDNPMKWAVSREYEQWDKNPQRRKPAGAF